MKLPAKFEKGIDFTGALVALVVDLVLNLVCFTMLAPDTLTAAAFGLIGGMIVLFVFRSWSKGQKLAWLIFVSVVFFFDLSFSLEATRAQANTTQTVDLVAIYAADPELTRLKGKQDEVSVALADLQIQYKEAAKRDTMAELAEQMKQKQSESKYYEDQYQKRRELVEKNAQAKVKHVKLSADAIFSAIPNAYKDGRYLQLIVYGLIFFGLQLIVAVSIEPITKAKKKSWIAELLKARREVLDEPPTATAPVRKVALRNPVPEKPAVIEPVAEPPVESEPPAPVVGPPPAAPGAPKPAPERVLPKKPAAITDELLRNVILAPARDNELKSPDVLAYETGINIDTLNRFFAALARSKGPAGKELIYQRNGKWCLSYTKEMVLASLAKSSELFKYKE